MKSEKKEISISYINEKHKRLDVVLESIYRLCDVLDDDRIIVDLLRIRDELNILTLGKLGGKENK